MNLITQLNRNFNNICFLSGVPCMAVNVSVQHNRRWISPRFYSVQQTTYRIGNHVGLATTYVTAIFIRTGTAVLEFNYEGEARESFRTPSFWKQKRRAARFATSSSLFLTYLVVISSDFKTDSCAAHTAVRRW